MAKTIDRGHGRIETRIVRTTTVLNDYVEWPYLGQAFRIDRHVTDLDGSHPRDEVALGITDLTPEQANAAHIGALVRGHWGIETRLHWERDMIYDEDRSQIRTQNGPRVMATLRNTAIGLLRRLQVPNIQRAVNYLNRHPEHVARVLLG
ncbi:ISAs1 family transposase [Sulfobacillus sp. DSM 109850]|uniref:ISAs1 family transposase n=1 Tax=Sulfobacillus harzensis TaxID=2729629 RepID=A0A7Y0Q0Z3_9FIRM|nr:ISAs1 family transposase [Sulfobacillus harzensis]